MKLRKLLFITLFIVMSSFAQEEGKELFKAKCSTCHSLEIPQNSSSIVAPPARGLMFHLTEIFKTKEDIKSHIKSITLNPTKQKAVLRAVRRFGLMPSQKGLITEEELDVVANWMVNNLSMSEAEHNINQQKHRQNQ